MAKRNQWAGFFFLLNMLLILFYLTACLIPFVGESLSWLVSMVGLAFPYLLFLLIFFFIFWLISSGKKFSLVMVAINLLVILLGYQQIKAAIGFHFFAKSDPFERPEGIRFMSWNVSKLDVSNFDNKNGNTFQPMMYDLIQQVNPDVICLQEFFNCIDPNILPSYIQLLQQKGYPYYFFSPTEFLVTGKFQSGIAIFSRFPISDTAFFNPFNAGHAEGFQFADITIRDKKIRVFNTGMESTGFTGEDVSAAKKGEGSRTLFYKLKYSNNVRDRQAAALKEQMNSSPFPVVLAADMNSVPNSKIYFLLEKNLQDAFIKKGSGFGRTFRFIAPNLRIDYLFIDPSFTVQQFNIVHKKYSDHYPIIADISE